MVDILKERDNLIYNIKFIYIGQFCPVTSNLFAFITIVIRNKSPPLNS